MGTMTIITDHLVLRRFRFGDENAMFQNYASDPLVSRFVSWSPHINVHESLVRVQMIMQNYERNDCYNWAITLKGKDEVIGNIEVVRYTEDGIPEIGYLLSRDYWGEGIMTEACLAVIRFLFKEVKFPYIIIKHRIENIGSSKVIHKCGFHYIRNEPYFSKKTGQMTELCCYELQNPYLNRE